MSSTDMLPLQSSDCTPDEPTIVFSELLHPEMCQLRRGNTPRYPYTSTTYLRLVFEFDKYPYSNLSSATLLGDPCRRYCQKCPRSLIFLRSTDPVYLATIDR